MSRGFLLFSCACCPGWLGWVVHLQKLIPFFSVVKTPSVRSFGNSHREDV